MGVLTREIMNSVSPIASLSASMHDMINGTLKGKAPLRHMEHDPLLGKLSDGISAVRAQ